MIENNIITFTNLRHAALFRDPKMNKYFEGIPEHWLPLIYPFEQDKPQKYYKEETCSEARTTLDVFLKKGKSFSKWVKRYSEEINSGFSEYQRITKTLVEIEKNTLDMQAVQHDWLPTYLKIIEGIWYPLGKAIVGLTEKPIKGKKDINGLKTKLDKLSFHFNWGWNKLLRDNIAHQLYRNSNQVHQNDVILLKDSQENEEIIFFKMIREFTQQLYDCCSGMLYPILLSLARLENTYSTLDLSPCIRENLLTENLKDIDINVLKNDRAPIDGGHQRNIEIDYRRSPDISLTYFGFHVLRECQKYLPSAQYFVSVYKKDKLLYCIQVSDSRLSKVLSNKEPLEEFLNSGCFQIFFIKSNKLLEKTFKPGMWRKFFFWKFLWVNLRKNFRFKKIKGYTTITEEKQYVARDLRSHVYIVLERDLSLKEIKNIVIRETHKRMSPFRRLFLSLWDVISYPLSRNKRARSYHSIVLLTFWKKEKRFSDMIFNAYEGNPMCVACSEWNNDKHFQHIREKKDTDIDIHGTTLRFFESSRDKFKEDIEKE